MCAYENISQLFVGNSKSKEFTNFIYSTKPHDESSGKNIVLKISFGVVLLQDFIKRIKQQQPGTKMCVTVENIAGGTEEGRQFFSDGNETNTIMCLHDNQQYIDEHKRVG